MAYDARAVANEILLRAWENGIEPTQLDIQKITYFLHGHFLLEHNKPLVSSEFEAMPYGPVQRNLLESFRQYGEEPIRELAMRFDPVRRTYSEFPRIMDNSVLEILERYLAFYLGFSSFQLVAMTHASGTPWSETVQRAKNAVNIGMRISNDLISSRFEGIRTA